MCWSSSRVCFVMYLFQNYINLTDNLSPTDECGTIVRCKISQLLFEDDLALLASEFGLQQALNGFAATCDIGEMKISNFRTEILHLSKNPVQCFFASIEGGGEVQISLGWILE